MFALSLKTRLILLISFLLVLICGMGLMGLNGMRLTNIALKKVFSENLKTTDDFGQIVGYFRDTRTQLLLALQHDSKNEFSSMHDHPLNLHVDLVTKNLEEIKKIWSGYNSRPRGEEEKKLAGTFDELMNKVITTGIIPARDAIAKNEFTEANRLILQVLNPAYAQLRDAMAKLQENERNDAQAEYKAAESRYNISRNLIVSGILAALILGIAISFMMIRSISHCAASLKDASARLAGGDLTARVAITSNDEMGEIGAAFNHMGDSFSGIIEKVRESATQVASAAIQLTGTATQMATSAEEVAAQAGTVATAGEEMAATSMEIAQNCAMAAEGAASANASATTGAEVVENSVTIMNRIAQRVKESAGTVEALGERGDQIGAIVGTIQDIADQTNLLALNAAIEAARAGEQGRGFAVVADEVRALAERTTKATKEISQMIKVIQQETRTAVSSMEEGVREVETGTGEAARSGEALNGILAQIGNVTMQVSQIATAAEQQTSTTTEISGNIMQITEVVQYAARGAHESADAAHSLANLAEDLKSLVAQFKTVQGR